jgi:hypothetical protein
MKTTLKRQNFKAKSPAKNIFHWTFLKFFNLNNQKINQFMTGFYQ